MPKENRSEVIYQIPCSRCPQTYIGQTGRTLGQRLKEHQRAVRDRNTSTSALANHVGSTGHQDDWNKAKLLDRCPHTSKRCLLEVVDYSEATLNPEQRTWTFATCIKTAFLTFTHTHTHLVHVFCIILMYIS